MPTYYPTPLSSNYRRDNGSREELPRSLGDTAAAGHRSFDDLPAAHFQTQLRVSRQVASKAPLVFSDEAGVQLPKKIGFNRMSTQFLFYKGLAPATRNSDDDDWRARPAHPATPGRGMVPLKSCLRKPPVPEKVLGPNERPLTDFIKAPRNNAQKTKRLVAAAQAHYEADAAAVPLLAEQELAAQLAEEALDSEIEAAKLNMDANKQQLSKVDTAAEIADTLDAIIPDAAAKTDADKEHLPEPDEQLPIAVKAVAEDPVNSVDTLVDEAEAAAAQVLAKVEEIKDREIKDADAVPLDEAAVAEVKIDQTVAVVAAPLGNAVVAEIEIDQTAAVVAAEVEAINNDKEDAQIYAEVAAINVAVDAQVEIAQAEVKFDQEPAVVAAETEAIDNDKEKADIPAEVVANNVADVAQVEKAVLPEVKPEQEPPIATTDIQVIEEQQDVAVNAEINPATEPPVTAAPQEQQPVVKCHDDPARVVSIYTEKILECIKQIKELKARQEARRQARRVAPVATQPAPAPAPVEDIKSKRWLKSVRVDQPCRGELTDVLELVDHKGTFFFVHVTAGTGHNEAKKYPAYKEPAVVPTNIVPRPQNRITRWNIQQPIHYHNDSSFFPQHQPAFFAPQPVYFPEYQQFFFPPPPFYPPQPEFDMRAPYFFEQQYAPQYAGYV